MSRANAYCFLILAASSLLFILGGAKLERSTPMGLLDFKVLYFGASCFTHHCDPYNEKDLRRFYTENIGKSQSDPASVRFMIVDYDYLPTTFLFTAPFAMLPWGLAHVLWTSITTACFILACFLIWTVCAPRAPVISALLIGFLLASSEVIFAGGNAVGLVVSLCTIAVWCFVQGRFGWMGAICMAIALLIKPHDVGPVWLFFLLTRGIYRKRALQTLGIATVLALAALVWAARVTPHWIEGLHTNLTSLSTHGGMNDPAPGSSVDRSAGMVVDMQSVISIFQNNPTFYNLLTYSICGALILLWAIKIMKSRPANTMPWFALAAVVPLSMLVTYHKPYDVKLILLAVPACILLWAERGRVGQAALLLTAGTIVFAADIPLAVYAALTDAIHPDTASFSGKLLAVIVLRPVSIVLMGMTAFYLWVFLRRNHSPLDATAPSTQTGD